MNEADNTKAPEFIDLPPQVRTFLTERATEVFKKSLKGNWWMSLVAGLVALYGAARSYFGDAEDGTVGLSVAAIIQYMHLHFGKTDAGVNWRQLFSYVKRWHAWEKVHVNELAMIVPYLPAHLRQLVESVANQPPANMNQTSTPDIITAEAASVRNHPVLTAVLSTGRPLGPAVQLPTKSMFSIDSEGDEVPVQLPPVQVAPDEPMTRLAEPILPAFKVGDYVIVTPDRASNALDPGNFEHAQAGKVIAISRDFAIIRAYNMEELPVPLAKWRVWVLV